MCTVAYTQTHHHHHHLIHITSKLYKWNEKVYQWNCQQRSSRDGTKESVLWHTSVILPFSRLRQED